MRPAVVVCAYNRPGSLSRLLRSIARADHPRATPLIISIDAGGARAAEVQHVAESFRWTGGKKQIVRHQEHLGPKRHSLFVGELTREYGAVVRLEDDYYVSPAYYDFAVKALKYFQDDPRIAGISLYHLWFNGLTRDPFTPLPDQSDVYFVQTSWSHGQVFSDRQWNAYGSWFRSRPNEVTPSDRLHIEWSRLSKDDWLPPLAKYLVETDRYLVFPRASYCTNFGDPGTHFDRSTRFFQVPLQTQKRILRFVELDDALAVYDAFQEIRPKTLQRLVPDLASFDFEVDLNGTKNGTHLRRPYVITTQACRAAERRWGRELYPPEANIIENIEGSEIALCKTQDVGGSWYDRTIRRYRHGDYTRSRFSVGLLQHVIALVLRRLGRL